MFIFIDASLTLFKGHPMQMACVYHLSKAPEAALPSHNKFNCGTMIGFSIPYAAQVRQNRVLLEAGEFLCSRITT